MPIKLNSAETQGWPDIISPSVDQLVSWWLSQYTWKIAYRSIGHQLLRLLSLWPSTLLPSATSNKFLKLQKYVNALVKLCPYADDYSRSLKRAMVPRGWPRKPSMRSCFPIRAAYPFATNDLKCTDVTETKGLSSPWQVVTDIWNEIVQDVIVTLSPEHAINNIWKRFLTFSDSLFAPAQFFGAECEHFTCTITTQPSSNVKPFRRTVWNVPWQPSHGIPRLWPTFFLQAKHLSPPIGDGLILRLGKRCGGFRGKEGVRPHRPHCDLLNHAESRRTNLMTGSQLAAKERNCVAINQRKPVDGVLVR